MQRSVLLVEDDQDYCGLLEEAFSQAGFRTLRASNGETALKLLRSEEVDLVVSDFIMPELNGLELCRLMENLNLPDVKVVLYSCNTDAMFRKRARELGALEYLPKTDDTEALVRQVCEVAGLAAEEEASRAAADGHGEPEELLRSIAYKIAQLSLLLGSLLDLIEIVRQGEQTSPTTRLAWDAAQRTGGDLKHILNELQTATKDWMR